MELFERLRALRQAIAAERSVPAFVIFSDAALRDILTGDQYAELQQIREDHLISRLQIEIANLDAWAGRRVEHLSGILELSDAQAESILGVRHGDTQLAQRRESREHAL